MSRRLGFNLPSIPQHIVQRGNNRQTTFVADESSYGHHAEGKLEISIRDHPRYLALGPIEQECQAAYRDLFRYQLDPGLIDEMREATKQGLIIDSDRFKSEIEAILNRAAIACTA